MKNFVEEGADEINDEKLKCEGVFSKKCLERASRGECVIFFI